LRVSRRYFRLSVLTVLTVVVCAAGCWSAWRFLWIPSAISRGRLALAEQDWQQAVVHLEKYLQQEPESSEAEMLLAQALAEQGFLHRSLESLRKVSDAHELGAKARWHEASLWLQLGYTVRAENAAKRCLELNQESLDARQLLSTIYRMQKRGVEAEETLWEIYASCVPSSRVLALAQLFEVHYSSPTDQQRLDQLKVFLQNDQDDWWSRLALGRLYTAAALEEKAKEQLTYCWKERPGHPAVRVAMTQFHLAFSEYRRAKRVLATWPEEDKNVEYQRLTAVYAHEVQNDLDGAIAACQLVVAQVPDDWRLRHRLAVCLRTAGLTKQSEEQFHRANAVRDALVDRHVEELLGQLGDVVSSAEVRFRFGRLYETVGRIREASCWYREVLALDSSHDEAKQRLAVIAKLDQ